jgi:chromosome segregation ATPase
MTNGEYRELVEFLTRHFAEIDQRFAVIDRRFDAMDRRFDAIERRLDTHDERFRDILGHLEAIYGRLERLEQEYYAILEGLRRIEATLADERARREALERGLAELRERVGLLQSRIDEVERRLKA